ncbi:cytochrome c oxidase polypeptide VI [Xylariaceae sp. FL0804]|nr:cytochrome c oxidase polypeptide VI [Xylariaceae sp. FL0804]
MSTSLLRIASRSSSRTLFRANRSVAPVQSRSSRTPGLVAGTSRLNFSTTPARRSNEPEETFEEFNDRFEKEFDGVHDVFELQRNLNNVFAYDLVPSPAVVLAAVKAARRVNDYPTAVRVFEAVKAKVENNGQYQQYLDELEPIRKEYSIMLMEEMYPNVPMSK